METNLGHLNCQNDVLAAFVDEHVDELRQAKKLLTNPGMAIKIADFLGKPIEKGFDFLPDKWNDKFINITKGALLKTLKGMLKTFKKYDGKSHPVIHKVAASVSGGAAGAIGLAAVAVELPLSTSIMMRSIAEIARENGEDIRAIETQLACMEVFALGGINDVRQTESEYYAIRAALALAVNDAVQYVGQKAVIEESAPWLIRFISSIASRFSIQVSDKVLASAVPVIGAVGGAGINYIFLDHFQKISKAHFTVRRLERQYGAEEVKRMYATL